ncbi:hypothetical protein TCAL_03868 [Tigriopus californicus]|uniref:Uncharacterized protein n=1 Tax=Tigriopus californicus TaxID=6832 RepID=A0A553PF83_TIGCA|nr:protein RCC2 homolog [Tigriopus californicus]TRY76334.1 hypothetical protein TCAL_03868 [Tigriopus californicus]
MANKRPGEGAEGSDDQSQAKKGKGTEDFGLLLFSGATDWEFVGRKANNLPRSKNTFWKPIIMETFANMSMKAVYSGPNSVHIFAINEEGQVFAWGRNEQGQLGLGDTKDRKKPAKVEFPEGVQIAKIATGKNHSLFLTDAGEIFACGDNRHGQTSGGKKDSKCTKPTRVSHEGPSAKHIACGGDFSAFVGTDGSIWTWGHPEHGQLGHNTEGQYIEKAGKVNYDYVYNPSRISTFVEKDARKKNTQYLTPPNIVTMDCGTNHCVAVDSNNKAYSWGFGGYGRLGHSCTDNEMVPCLIASFNGPKRGIKSVTCGAQFNLAPAEIPGTTYMWGQYVSSKEANMYPKPIPDLSGWLDIKSIACSTKGWVLSADDTIIAAIPSPAYGELAMGEFKKSSAAPTEVKTLDGLKVAQCAMGLAYSLFLARVEPDKVDALKKKYPVIAQVDD